MGATPQAASAAVDNAKTFPLCTRVDAAQRIKNKTPHRIQTDAAKHIKLETAQLLASDSSFTTNNNSTYSSTPLDKGSGEALAVMCLKEWLFCTGSCGWI